MQSGSSGEAAVKAPLPHRQLVVNSRALQEVISLVERYAPKPYPIVIMGETGTGKRLIAEHINDRSDLKGKFFFVNCAAIPETLIESELFGSEPGAYTGAPLKGKKGFFERADGGTLFLDEIGDLPFPMQVKLFGALDGRFYRLGGTEPLTMNARIIVATNVAAVEGSMGHKLTGFIPPPIAVAGDFKRADGTFLSFAEIEGNYLRAVWDSLPDKNVLRLAKAINTSRHIARKFVIEFGLTK